MKEFIIIQRVKGTHTMSCGTRSDRSKFFCLTLHPVQQYGCKQENFWQYYEDMLYLSLGWYAICAMCYLSYILHGLRSMEVWTVTFIIMLNFII